MPCEFPDNTGMYPPPAQDHLIIAKDPRDTLPIRPSRYGSVQAWEGVIFREVHSVNILRDQYPHLAHHIVPTADGLLASIRGLFQRIAPPMQTPADTLSGLSGVPRGAGPVRSGDTLYYRMYLDYGLAGPTQLRADCQVGPSPTGDTERTTTCSLIGVCTDDIADGTPHVFELDLMDRLPTSTTTRLYRDVTPPGEVVSYWWNITCVRSPS